LATTFTTIRLPVGARVKVPVAVYRAGTSPAGKAEVRWTSSSAKVATVTKGKAKGTANWAVGGTGKLTVKALAKGKAKLILTSPGAKRLVLKIEVVRKAPKVSSVAVRTKAKAVKVGKSVVLKAKASPARAGKTIATWRSNRPAIARVDAAGRVTGLAKGRAVITLKVDGKTTRKTITVKR
jgi:uncharacterized protein YjdB